jgi:hypothetical protein
MNKIKFLLIILLSTGSAFDLKNYCRRTLLKCHKSFNSKFEHNNNCENLNCHGEYNFSCSEICSKTKKDCEDFQNHLSKKHYISEINKCPKIAHSLCSLEEKECFVEKNSLWFRSRAYKKIKCPCPKEHSYECGLKYCASDSDTCRKLKRKNIPFEKIQMKPCHNDQKKSMNRNFYQKIF